jgi:hypothetical protein
MVASSASAELEDEFDETYLLATLRNYRAGPREQAEGSKGSSDLKEELF